MTKSIKAALIALCAGALIAGIGFGVAALEYSSLRFEMLKLEDADQPIIESKTFTVPAEGNIEVNGSSHGNFTLMGDESVPVNTVVITAHASGWADGIEFDGPYMQQIEPWWDDDYISDGTVQETVMLTSFNAYPTTDTSNVPAPFRYKDQVLQGLKDGVVYLIPSAYESFTIEARVNPADIPRVLM